MSLKKYLNKIKPHFEEGNKLHAFWSVYDGFENFFYIPNTTTKTGAHVHDAIDSERIMSSVVIALLPVLLFGMYSIGYQNFAAARELANASFQEMFFYGFLVVLPKILVSHIVGLGIKLTRTRWEKEEIQKGYLITDILMSFIIPITYPLWMSALLVVFAVIFCKEIFDGASMNISNVALSARAFLFFSYPRRMVGDSTWITSHQIFGLGNILLNAITMTTPLGELAPRVDIPYPTCDMLIGLIPGSVGETSVITIVTGVLLLLVTSIASRKTMLSVFVNGGPMAALFSALGMMSIVWYEHLILGGFCFDAVLMTTDPVTSARTGKGKYIYSAPISVMTVIIHVMNSGYPESMMLSILFANIFAPSANYCIVQGNIDKRMERLTVHNE